MRSPGGWESSLSACPGVGNRLPSQKKIANPRGYFWGGMVTGRIEQRIIPEFMQDEVCAFLVIWGGAGSSQYPGELTVQGLWN